MESRTRASLDKKQMKAFDEFKGLLINEIIHREKLKEYADFLRDPEFLKFYPGQPVFISMLTRLADNIDDFIKKSYSTAPWSFEFQTGKSGEADFIEFYDAAARNLHKELPDELLIDIHFDQERLQQAMDSFRQLSKNQFNCLALAKWLAEPVNAVPAAHVGKAEKQKLLGENSSLANTKLPFDAYVNEMAPAIITQRTSVREVVLRDVMKQLPKESIGPLDAALEEIANIAKVNNFLTSDSVLAISDAKLGSCMDPHVLKQCLLAIDLNAEVKSIVEELNAPLASNRQIDPLKTLKFDKVTIEAIERFQELTLTSALSDNPLDTLYLLDDFVQSVSAQRKEKMKGDHPDVASAKQELLFRLEDKAFQFKESIMPGVVEYLDNMLDKNIEELLRDEVGRRQMQVMFKSLINNEDVMKRISGSNKVTVQIFNNFLEALDSGKMKPEVSSKKSRLSGVKKIAVNLMDEKLTLKSVLVNMIAESTSKQAKQRRKRGHDELGDSKILTGLFNDAGLICAVLREDSSPLNKCILDVALIGKGEKLSNNALDRLRENKYSKPGAPKDTEVFAPWEVGQLVSFVEENGFSKSKLQLLGTEVLPPTWDDFLQSNRGRGEPQRRGSAPEARVQIGRRSVGPRKAASDPTSGSQTFQEPPPSLVTPKNTDSANSSPKPKAEWKRTERKDSVQGQRRSTFFSSRSSSRSRSGSATNEDRQRKLAEEAAERRGRPRPGRGGDDDNSE